MRRTRTLTSRPVVVAATVAVAAAVVTTAPVSSVPAAAVSPAETCPAAMPTADIVAGMTGTGYTVVQGTEPVAFGAEVLGVQRDAILPGIDLVIARLNGPPIEQAGGIWLGMSGSPVFAEDGRLLGAVAWSLTFGPSDIVGLTAGEDLRALVTSPTEPPAFKTAQKADWIALSDRTERTIAAAEGVSTSSVGQSLVPLPLPVSVSGLGSHGLARLSTRLEQRGASARVFAGSSAAVGAVGDETELVPGSNFAAALSYGAVTSAAIGTTTIKCGNEVVAFGHPFDERGLADTSANTATAITIIKDPLDHPYKMANLDGAVGMLDFDGFTGVHANLDVTPTTVPVHSRIHGQDTNRTVDGTTYVVARGDLPFIAWEHVYASALAAMLRYGDGSSTASFVVHGLRQDGHTAWSVSFKDTYVSADDAAYPAAADLESVLSRLQGGRFETVRVTSVDVPTATIRRAQQRASITAVLVAVNGGAYRTTTRVVARPGALLGLRIQLRWQDGTIHYVYKSFRVPTTTLGLGQIEVVGGPHSRERAAAPASFDGLLTNISTRVTSNNLAARLWMGARVVGRANQAVDRVVDGYKTIPVEVRR